MYRPVRGPHAFHPPDMNMTKKDNSDSVLSEFCKSDSIHARTHISGGTFGKPTKNKHTDGEQREPRRDTKDQGKKEEEEPRRSAEVAEQELRSLDPERLWELVDLGDGCAGILQIHTHTHTHTHTHHRSPLYVCMCGWVCVRACVYVCNIFLCHATMIIPSTAVPAAMFRYRRKESIRWSVCGTMVIPSTAVPAAMFRYRHKE
jgi:hypothetical protein